MTTCKQRLGKHRLKAKIISEEEIIFAKQRLGKQMFPRQRMLTKAFPWQHDKTKELFDMVTYIPAA
jgi:hypothetical protein